MKNIKIIAEVACAHEGDINKIYQLIDAAAQSSADAVQLHFFQADEHAIPGYKNFDLAYKLQIPLKDYEKIFQRADESGIDVWANVGDVTSATEANKYKPSMWRVHSSDINNVSLFECLCKTEVPITLSAGGSTLEEIDFAINEIRNLNGKLYGLVHGFQGYPTPIEEANLEFIQTLSDRYDLVIGYQDHMDGDDPLGFVLPAMALCFNAQIIEKHITLDRSQKGIDYHSSLNPDEFLKFVKEIKKANEAIGDQKRAFGKLEEEYRKTFKKGLVFRRDLPLESEITAEDIKMVRSNDLEIYGIDINKVIGKTIKANVKGNQKVTWGELK